MAGRLQVSLQTDLRICIEGPERGVKGNELVWRTLIDHAFEGERTWSSVADLAERAGVPSSTAALALRKLISVGSVTRFIAGGLALVDPGKVLAVACAWRNLERDRLASTSLTGLDMLAERPEVRLGGTWAAAQLLNDEVADHVGGIVYVSSAAGLGPLPAGDEVLVLRLDQRADRDWLDTSSPAQTYIDLFATPGWSASEYRSALRAHYLDGQQ